MSNIGVDSLRCRFDLLDDGLYYKVGVGKFKPGTKAGSAIRGEIIVRFLGVDYYVKNLVYLHHHGVWSDYDLSHYDKDYTNNGILNLLEEGETLIRLNNGLRYDPENKVYYKRQYLGHSLHCKYVEVSQ